MSALEPLPTRHSLVVSNAKPAPTIPVGSSGLRKPDGWPAVMQWPPKRVSDAIRVGTLNETNVDKFQAYYDKYAQLSVRQADLFKDHLTRHASHNEDIRRVPLLRIKKRLGYDNTRNHDHIAWAFLLDPNGDFRSSYDQSIMSIGRTSLTTLDGGKVYASETGLRVRKFSPMAAHAVVEEALARGWDHIEIKGSPKLVAEVMKYAKSRGLEVQASVTGPFGIPLGKPRAPEVMAIDQKAHEELADLGKMLSELDPSGEEIKNPEQRIEDSGDAIPLV